MAKKNTLLEPLLTTDFHSFVKPSLNKGNVTSVLKPIIANISTKPSETGFGTATEGGNTGGTTLVGLNGNTGGSYTGDGSYTGGGGGNLPDIPYEPAPPDTPTDPYASLFPDFNTFLQQGGFSDYAGLFSSDESKRDAALKKQFGFTDEQLKSFKKFFIPFQTDRFKKLLGDLRGTFNKETGFIQNQFENSLSGLRQRLLQQTLSARQNVGGFAGTGAQQRNVGLLGKGSKQGLVGLINARSSGLYGSEQRAESRLADLYSTIGNYLSRTFGTAKDIFGLDITDPHLHNQKDDEFLDYTGETKTINGVEYYWSDENEQGMYVPVGT